ncbi:hypothetical protein ACLQ2N_32910 [Streptomyces sp. DT224]|uniref:hypothetical protein n=1 Tax=Streptomyces sp. DT224 TaxID=3393426 RepID=UPI003CEF5058
MSSNSLPKWTSTLSTSVVWSGTDSDAHFLHAFGEDGKALCNRRIRARGHRDNTAYYRSTARVEADVWPGNLLHDRCRDKAEAKVAAHPEAQQRAAEDAAWAAEIADRKRQEQYRTAMFVFGETCYAANHAVVSYQENADTTIAEGGPEFTPVQVWGHIDGGLDDYGPAEMAHCTEERTPVAALRATWYHLDALARAGALSGELEEEEIAEARTVLAAATVAALAEESDDPAPVVLDKTPESWQVLFHQTSTLTSDRWADLPLHSVVRTEQLLNGYGWREVDMSLTARGLARYGVTASSAGHALMVARKRWETEGPHAAWFRFLAEEAPAIEALRAEYAPTPARERAAFEFATAAAATPAPDLTLADLHAIATGARTNA